jgi:hypothetical protein
MKNNKTYSRVFLTLLITLILMGAAATSAYANADETASSSGVEDTTPTAVSEPEVPPADPVRLTPDGNLTLVDDISGAEATDKQFVTVITKGGNYFYLVIDRAGDSENVYFLNLVDESDLLALIDGEQSTPSAVTEPEPAPVPEPEPVQEPEPKPDSGSNMGLIFAVIALIALGGGGALLYIKVLKPRTGASGKVDISELDDFGYDDELDELTQEPDEMEYEPVEIDDEGKAETEDEQ